MRRRWCSRLSYLAPVLLLASSCYDFGPAVTPDGGDPGGDGGTCEREVPPSDIGPQVRYIPTNSIDVADIHVQSGEVVTWTNDDMMGHSVVAGAPGAEIPPSSGGFESRVFYAGEKWAFRFCDKRTVEYYCGTHPLFMKGYHVIVE